MPTAPAAPAAKPVSEIERLRAELAAANAKLAAKAKPKISLKVSEKGAVSAYGLGRFPVTLYREQWEAVLDKADDIRAFIAANAARLKTKGD
ncbi:MAG: hypothetical protein QOE70_2108 [Chthoniobacter sp.]|jgi:hypothetical protein|nr:hypothetical protein [Chthoniobacter sp.]